MYCGKLKLHLICKVHDARSNNQIMRLLSSKNCAKWLSADIQQAAAIAVCHIKHMSFRKKCSNACSQAHLNWNSTRCGLTPLSDCRLLLYSYCLIKCRSCLIIKNCGGGFWWNKHSPERLYEYYAWCMACLGLTSMFVVQVVMIRCITYYLTQPEYYTVHVRMFQSLLFKHIMALEAVHCTVVAMVSNMEAENRALPKLLQMIRMQPSFAIPWRKIEWWYAWLVFPSWLNCLEIICWIKVQYFVHKKHFWIYVIYIYCILLCANN